MTEVSDLGPLAFLLLLFPRQSGATLNEELRIRNKNSADGSILLVQMPDKDLDHEQPAPDRSSARAPRQKFRPGEGRHRYFLHHPGRHVFHAAGSIGMRQDCLPRITAEFEQQDSDGMIPGGSDISNLRATDRHVKTVFQRYALIPDMTIYEDVDFGFRARKFQGIEIVERVTPRLEMPGLESMRDRLPHNSPAARNSGSNSPAPWLTNQTSCSSMNRFRHSTPIYEPSCMWNRASSGKYAAKHSSWFSRLWTERWWIQKPSPSSKRNDRPDRQPRGSLRPPENHLRRPGPLRRQHPAGHFRGWPFLDRVRQMQTP